MDARFEVNSPDEEKHGKLLRDDLDRIEQRPCASSLQRNKRVRKSVHSRFKKVSSSIRSDSKSSKTFEKVKEAAKLTIGHIEPCLAQLTILSIVPKAYSTPFLGVSKDNWLEPTLANPNAFAAVSSVMGL